MLFTVDFSSSTEGRIGEDAMQTSFYQSRKRDISCHLLRGVATGWTAWVDMSTPLLPEVVPEIDTNPVSFYSGGGGVGGRSWFGA